MKVILADKKGFPYFENLPHRKSYITTKWDGTIIDTPEEMNKNQNEYMKVFFPENSKKMELDNWDEIFPDNQGTSLREVTLSPGSFLGEDFTKDFTYWNNVSYCKIIYDSGFFEYCYIIKRKCLNYSASQWKFTLSVDIYNTYWINYIYPKIKESNLSVLVLRRMEDRFKKVNYEGTDYWVLSKLVDQKNILWNREKNNDNFKNKYTIYSNKTFVPWTDVSLKGNILLEKLYGKKYGTLFSGENGFNLMVVINSSKEIFKAHSELWNFKKTLNNVYYAPVINNEAIISIGHLKDEETFKKYFVKRIGSGSSINGAVANAVLETQNKIMWPYVISVIFVPKPPLTPILDGEFDDYVYEPRKGKIDKNSSFKHVGEIIYRDSDGSSAAERDLFIISNSDKEKNDYSEDEITGNSFDNALCDERIPMQDIVVKMMLSGKEEKIQEANDELEPNLYGEDFFEVEYSKTTGISMKISLIWYFFNNYRDLIKSKSLFLMGYQFIQPNIVKLIQWVGEGLYKKFNEKTLSVFLETEFTPNLQIIQSKLQQFLLDNQSRMNAQMITSGIESAKGVAESSFNPVLSLGATGGSVKKNDKLRSGIFGGIETIASPFGIIETALEQSSIKSDLARSQADLKLNDGESSFKIINASNGRYKFNWLNENDKKRVADYHRQTGYMCGRLEKINNFVDRIFYNFLQVGNFKVLLKDAEISTEYKEYFENLLLNGVTFWHDFISEDGKKYNDLGNYTLENWETKIVGELK